MSYKISITKTEEVERTMKEYQIIADTGNPKDNGRQWDYVPVNKIQVRDSEILKMEVENLNLEIVVAAIFNSNK